MTFPSTRIAAFLAALACGPAIADVWDVAASSDDAPMNANAMAHGAVQVHDMGVRPGPVTDQDWYYILVPPYTSFEVQIDGMTGNLDLISNDVERVAEDGTTVLQSSITVDGASRVRRIAWLNPTSVLALSFIRVSGADCGITCNANDQYTIRPRETTVGLARFNNSASQTTILLLQNLSSAAISGRVQYWSPTGTLLTTYHLVALGPRNLLVHNTSADVPGQSGSITIAHNGPYGTLNAKAVALEPATGFSFDTPGVIRP